jgi:hypothetical protein
MNRLATHFLAALLESIPKPYRDCFAPRNSRALATTARVLKCGLIVGCILCSSSAVAEPQRILLSDIGSERATSGSGNKLVTFGGKTHVVWQDRTKEGYFNRVRTYDHKTKELSPTVTLNKGKDNHARPVIAVDQGGYLHVVMSGHNSPVMYRRSEEPNDISSWTKAEPAGSGTYPVLMCDSNGTLYLTLRSAVGWNGVDFYRKEPDKPWEKVQKLVKRDPKLPGYAGFASGMAWNEKEKKLHMVVDFYESKGVYDKRGLHQAVCYLHTKDQGDSWQTASTKKIELPARPESLDVLAQNTDPRQEPMPPPVVLAQGNICTDEKGMPHILYVSHAKRPGELIHATTDEKGHWQQSSISAAEKDFPRLRPISCRGAFTADQDGAIYALIELTPDDASWRNGLPVRERAAARQDLKQLAWLISQDSGETFKCLPALPKGTVFNQANVERPAGFNEIGGGRQPSFIYFDGTSNKKGPSDVVQNNVYLVLAEPESE